MARDRPGLGQRLGQAFNQGAQDSQSVLSGNAVGGVVAGAVIASGIGTVLMAALANPLTAIPTAIAGTVGALAGLTVATKSLAESFKEFSPSLSGQFAMAEVRQIMRSQRVGEAIAPNVGPLVDAIENLKDAFEPILVDILKGAADISRGFVEVVRSGKYIADLIADTIGKYSGPVIDVLKDIYKHLTGNPWPGKKEEKPVQFGPGWGIIDPKRPAAFRPEAGAPL